MARKLPPRGELASSAQSFIAANGWSTYATQYETGWRHGVAGTGDSILDAGRETEAWMHGYLDGAHGLRAKWHLTTCQHHANRTGGCGEA